MGKAAPAPNYQGAAQQQAASSQANVGAQTQANRPDINTPWASQQWSQGPNGQWSMSTGLNGQLGNAASNLQGQIDQNTGQPVMNGNQARDQAITASYDESSKRLGPQFDQAQEQLQQQLANQGLDPNSTAYQNAVRQLGAQKNDAYGSAMNSAIGQGAQAGQALFNQNLQARNAPLQELQGLQGFMSMPGFNAANQADPTQYLNAANLGGQYGLEATQMNNRTLADSIFGARNLLLGGGDGGNGGGSGGIGLYQLLGSMFGG